jgi:UDP-N-acetylglucosamine--N-acetylmuramyl-(pentapeptide) pyrophosphoryl-undecaprenol N-acetylglucosamine transferase
MEKASVLIPSPNVSNNHQYKNAKSLSDKNATELLEEKNLSSESLTLAVKGILENEERKNELEKNVSLFALEDANRRVYEEIISTIKK